MECSLSATNKTVLHPQRNSILLCISNFIKMIESGKMVKPQLITSPKPGSRPWVLIVTNIGATLRRISANAILFELTFT